MKNLFMIFLVIFWGFCGVSLAQVDLNKNITGNSNNHQVHSSSNTNYLERIGEWPYGPSFSIAVDSVRDIIFLGCGGGLLILDGTDKSNPQLITDTIRTAGLIEDIFYDAATERLYLACGEGGYEIWNVEEPSVPFLYSRNEIYYFDVETPVGHVQVRGDFAIFECAWGYVNSVNVSDPYNPYRVSLNGFMGNPAHNIHIDQQGYIHATGQQNYVILSIDASGYLSEVGELPIYNCNAVFGGTDAYYVGQGDYLYIIYYGGNSSTDVGGLIHIEVRNHLAYIINDNGLNIWDVSYSNNPFLVSNTITENYPADLYVAGTFAYVAVGSAGLNIFDIRDPSSPLLVGSYDGYSSTYTSVVKDSLAYASRLSDGLSIIDISNLEYPELIGQFETSGYNYDVALKDSLAFLSCWDAGFKIVDVSDPTSPVLVSAIENFNASKLVLSENYVFIVETYPPNTSYNIKIVDITDPENPFEVSSTPFQSYVNELAYNSGYLFIATNDQGLIILDVADPQNPVEVNNLILPHVREVYIRNNLMYVCPDNYGLHVYDISNPEIPVEVTYYGFGAYFDVAVLDSFWYASDGDDIRLFYLEGSNPVYLDQYRFPYQIFDLEASGKFVYVADGAAGFSIYKNNLIENPPVTNWEFQVSGITQDIQAVYFTSLTEGWAAADDGLLLHTTDGGENWNIRQVGGSADDFYDLTFVNENTGWVCGDNGKMFKTTDRGQNWSAVNVPTTSRMRAICFLDESLGWTVTLEEHQILKTTDGGGTWTEQNSGLSGNLHHIDVFFTDELNGIVLGLTLPDLQSYILRTTDGGQTWNPNFNYQYNSLNTVFFANHDEGWIAGADGFIIKTTDGGDTWQAQNYTPGVFISDICFIDEEKGWYTGFEGAVYQSGDGGTSWLKNEILILDDLRGVVFYDESNGWVVGSNGIIIHYSENVTHSGNDKSQIPDNFELSQNYPNPFNSVTTIRYSIPESGNVSLKIYNTLGEEIKNLVNEYKHPGIYNIRFNGRNLSSGIYFFRLEVNNYSSVKKMILLK